MESTSSTTLLAKSTEKKLNCVFQQISKQAAKPIEDLKVDRFLDQLKKEVHQTGYFTRLLHDDAGLVQFFSTFSKNKKGQTWVMTFALKLWTVLLSCPDKHKLLTHSTNIEVPSYASAIGGQHEFKGQRLHTYLLDFLMLARNDVFWDEASVRNAWLLTVESLLPITEEKFLVESLLRKTDAINVAFKSLGDPSLFVVYSAQCVISASLLMLCKVSSQDSSVDASDSEHTAAKVMKLDISQGAVATEQLDDMLGKIVSMLQSQSVPHASTKIESRLHLNPSPNLAAETKQLKMATIGIVKRVWQSSDDKSVFRLVDDRLAWLPWCVNTLKEDGDQDICLAVMECLPDVLARWPWRMGSEELSCDLDNPEFKCISELFRLPVQVLRWQGIQYSLKLTRALYSAQCLMKSNVPGDVMKLIASQPSLIQLLIAPLTAILKIPDATPRRKLLGFVNPATYLIEVHDEIRLQLLEGKVHPVKLVCQCLSGLVDMVEKMSPLPIMQESDLLTNLSSLLSVCWHDNDDVQDTVQNKLRRSSKVTKSSLNLLADFLDKLLKSDRDYDDLRQYGVHDVFKSFINTITKVLSLSSNNQALMCKTLDVLTKLYQANAAISTTDSLLTASLLDCVQNLAGDTSCWEVRDSALGFLVAIVKYGNESDLNEAKKRKLSELIWDCAGDHEGFVQASGIAALPIVYERQELWQAMLYQCQITEVAIVSDIVHYLNLSGNPFVRTAAIATLTKWLTSHKPIQTSILQACTIKLTGAEHHKSSDVENATRKPTPKDIPGVVSGYFQDILEAETSSAIQSKVNIKDTETSIRKPPCGDNVTAISEILPSQVIGQQILSTMYRVTSSSDVETSLKTLDFWTCLFQLHVPECSIFTTCINKESQHSSGQIKTSSEPATTIQELFDQEKLTQQILLNTIAKPSHEAVESLTRCLDNTGCLKLMLSMLNDSKLVALRVCFVLQVIHGVFLATGESYGSRQRQFISDNDIQGPNVNEHALDTLNFEEKRDSPDLKDNAQKVPIPHADEVKSSHITTDPATSSKSDSQLLDKDITDLCQSIGDIKSDASFEELHSKFMSMDFALIKQIIDAREVDTLESTLDDMIEPSEEWGLPGDVNVDCY